MFFLLMNFLPNLTMIRFAMLKPVIHILYIYIIYILYIYIYIYKGIYMNEKPVCVCVTQ